MTEPGGVRPHAPLRVLVTGASGFIGRHLVARALAAGLDVRTLSRTPDGVPRGVPSDRRFLGRLPDDLPAGLLDGVDAVVHCAAWVAGARADADAVNVRGTLRLAEAAAQAGARPFVFLSTQSARVDATSDYGRTKFAAEEALRTAFADSPLDVVILRLGMVTGFGRRGVYRRLAEVTRRWPIVPLVGGEAIVQPLHVDDLSAAILRCIRESGDLRGRVLQLGAPDGTTLKRFMPRVAEAQSGRRKAVLAVPIALVARVVAFGERIGVPLPVTSENLKGVARVDPMDTRADMERLGIPVRALDAIVREDLAIESAVMREAARLGRYLVGRAPSPLLAARYADAVARLGVEIAADEARAWRLAARLPAALRVVDGGLALWKPNGTIRRRLHLMLAVLEASPEHCDAFLPEAAGLGERVAVVGAALRGGITGALGLVLVPLLGVRAR